MCLAMRSLLQSFLFNKTNSIFAVSFYGYSFFRNHTHLKARRNEISTTRSTHAGNAAHTYTHCHETATHIASRMDARDQTTRSLHALETRQARLGSRQTHPHSAADRRAAAGHGGSRTARRCGRVRDLRKPDGRLDLQGASHRSTHTSTRTCSHTHTHTHPHTYARTPTHIHMLAHPRTYICSRTHTNTHPHTYARTPTHPPAHTPTHMLAHQHTHARVRSHTG